MIIKATACALLILCGISTAAEETWMVSAGGMDVQFRSWQAEGSKARAGVLVLVPGYNGKGEQMLDARWREFAEKNDLILLAPTFHAEGYENNQGKGYYYPEQGSGEVMEKALRELKRRSGVDTEKVLFFGFSAGAHFSHRFALWKPQRVKAFVAYSAAWWSEPSQKLRMVPALIVCGETDERYAATYEFFKKGHKLGCPWVWRSYNETGHVLTPTVRNMAEVLGQLGIVWVGGSNWKNGDMVHQQGDLYGISLGRKVVHKVPLREWAGQKLVGAKGSCGQLSAARAA